MLRRSFLRRGAAGTVLGAAVAAPLAVQAQPAIRWRLASSFPKVLDTIYGSSEVFAKSVSDATGGRFQISVHQGGELVPALGVVDAVQAGTVECAHTAPYYFFGKDETFALDCTIPFGLNSRQLSAWMYDGDGMKLMRAFYASYSIVNFPMGNTGAQMGGWFRKEINSLDDLKGLKFRIGGFGGRVLQALGVVPQNIPAGDTYAALEKGTIDAAEWVGPYDDERLGFFKVAPYYYYPAWWEGGPQLALYVNDKAYNSLPADYKAVLESAASHAHVTMQARYDARNPAALKRLIAGGARMRAMSPAITEAAFKAANEVFDGLSASNPRWKPIYENYRAFRNDQVAWFRFSENAFDATMSRLIR